MLTRAIPRWMSRTIYDQRRLWTLLAAEAPIFAESYDEIDEKINDFHRDYRYGLQRWPSPRYELRLWKCTEGCLFVLIILYSLYLEYDNPLIHSCYSSSPSDKWKHRKRSIRYKGNGMKSQRKGRRLLLLRSFWRELPDISGCQEVHHRFIALLLGEQLRDLHVSAPARSPSRYFLQLFQSVFCSSFHHQRRRKWCFHVWAFVLPPPLHHQHLSSSRGLNRFKYVPTGACPVFGR